MNTTGAEELERTEQVLQDLRVGMYECPDRAWPGVEASLHASQVLLASEADDTAWLWNDLNSDVGEPPRVSSATLSELSPEWTSTFNVSAINGIPTLGISLDETAEWNASIEDSGGELWVDTASALTFHEAFHFLSGQGDWGVGAGSRFYPYPEPSDPRYLRAEVIRSFRAALDDAPGALAAAAHWQERLGAEQAPDLAAIRSFDVTEGSAEYASIMMSAIADLGCDAPRAELVTAARDRLGEGQFLGHGYDPGGEPYDLGLVAGLWLAQQGTENWEAEVESGVPPVEIALKGVEPVPQTEDPELREAVQADVDLRNEELKPEMDSLLERMAGEDHYRVVVDFGWVAGSFGLGGFYYLAEEDGEPGVLLRLDASLEPPSQANVEVMGLTSMIGIGTPCALGPGGTVVLAIPKSDLEYEDEAGVATSTWEGATFDALPVVGTTDEAGLEWLCPIDSGGVAPMPAPTRPNVRSLPQIRNIRNGGSGITATIVGQ